MSTHQQRRKLTRYKKTEEKRPLVDRRRCDTDRRRSINLLTSGPIEVPPGLDPPEVLKLMHRVTLIPVVRRTLFAPRITIFTKDGRSVTKEGTGREFIWDFEEEARRIRPVGDGTGISDAQFAEMIDACRRLDGLDGLDGAARTLISLTIRL